VGAGEQQTRDVGAGQQEYGPDDAQQEQTQRSGPLELDVGFGLDEGLQRLARGGVAQIQATEDGFGLGLGLR
jgi:hypothetical protein